MACLSGCRLRNRADCQRERWLPHEPNRLTGETDQTDSRVGERTKPAKQQSNRRNSIVVSKPGLTHDNEIVLPFLSSENTPTWESKAECSPRSLGHPSGSTKVLHPMGMHATRALRGQVRPVLPPVIPAAFQCPSRHRRRWT